MLGQEMECQVHAQPQACEAYVWTSLLSASRSRCQLPQILRLVWRRVPATPSCSPSASPSLPLPLHVSRALTAFAWLGVFVSLWAPPGLVSLKDLIFMKPATRPACVPRVLRFTHHSDVDVRTKAVRLASNLLHRRPAFQAVVEAYAKQVGSTVGSGPRLPPQRWAV